MERFKISNPDVIKIVDGYRNKFKNWILQNRLHSQDHEFFGDTIVHIFRSLKDCETDEPTCFAVYGHIPKIIWKDFGDWMMFELRTAQDRRGLAIMRDGDYRLLEDFAPAVSINKEQFDKEFTEMLQGLCKQ